MKRTTYIITGMLTLTLFALLSSIFFVVQRSKTKKYAVELSAEYKELSSVVQKSQMFDVLLKLQTGQYAVFFEFFGYVFGFYLYNNS